MANDNGSTPLPEAPASATMKIDVEGYEVLFTMRDHDAGALMVRLQKMVGWLQQQGIAPVTNSKGGRKSKSQYVEVPANGAPPVCPQHQAPMKASQYGGYYCTRKDEKGEYCSYKAK